MIFENLIDTKVDIDEILIDFLENDGDNRKSVGQNISLWGSQQIHYMINSNKMCAMFW